MSLYKLGGKYIKKSLKARQDAIFFLYLQANFLLKMKIKEIVPIENTIKTARKIENIHNLIMNNGNNFNLSKDELELAKKLV